MLEDDDISARDQIFGRSDETERTRAGPLAMTGVPDEMVGSRMMFRDWMDWGGGVIVSDRGDECSEWWSELPSLWDE